MSITEETDYPGDQPASRPVEARILEQMAEALEDEAAGLCRRAASYEEEEFLLCREIDERHTEINRLQLRLDSIRSERDGLLERIDGLRREAGSMRETSHADQKKITLARVEDKSISALDSEVPALASPARATPRGIFFHRMIVK